jgi:hypothetical protein
MKKKLSKLALVLVSVVGLAALVSCRQGNTTQKSDKPQGTDTNNSTVEENKIPTNDVNEEPQINYDDIVDYYGCPNSKRVKKLMTKRVNKIMRG